METNQGESRKPRCKDGSTRGAVFNKVSRTEPFSRGSKSWRAADAALAMRTSGESSKAGYAGGPDGSVIVKAAMLDGFSASSAGVGGDAWALCAARQIRATTINAALFSSSFGHAAPRPKNPMEFRHNPGLP